MTNINADSFNLTVDIAILSLINDELGVLLVKRKEDPDSGKWALPGGFIRKGESPDDAMSRVLKDKLGLNHIYNQHLDWFGDLDRDPRGQIPSFAYIGVVDYHVNASAKKDVLEVQWTPLSELPKDLAFDHKSIIESARNRMVSGIRWTEIGFHLMGSQFTIPELKSSFEKVINRSINLSNFRTKILSLDLLIFTNEYNKTGGKGKPAPFYNLNLDKLKALPPNVTIFN